MKAYAILPNKVNVIILTGIHRFTTLKVECEGQKAKAELSIHPTETQYLLNAYSAPGSVPGPGEVLRCRLGVLGSGRSHHKFQSQIEGRVAVDGGWVVGQA